MNLFEIFNAALVIGGLFVALFAVGVGYYVENINKEKLLKIASVGVSCLVIGLIELFLHAVS